jgi:hypothetical protein
MVVIYDLECYQVDINNAFIESDLREDIYIKLPLGVLINPGLALKVLRSLYGLK